MDFSKFKPQDWRARLSEESYRVTREGGTEAPYTGEHLEQKALGEYSCICCGTKLFVSDTKFDSGCGWPSFFKATEGAITYLADKSLGRERTEVRCTNCDAHLGHVFDDGPPPTGKRYCINSVCLTFEADSPE